MADLRTHALACEVLAPDRVQALYDLANNYGQGARRAVQQLCESHERLRAELQGVTALLAEHNRVWAGEPNPHKPE